MPRENYIPEEPTFWEKNNPFASPETKRKVSLWNAYESKTYRDDISRIYNEGMTEREVIDQREAAARSRQSELLDQYLDVMQGPDFDPSKQLDYYRGAAELNTAQAIAIDNNRAVNSLITGDRARDHDLQVMDRGYEQTVGLREMDQSHEMALKEKDFVNAKELNEIKFQQSQQANQELMEHEKFKWNLDDMSARRMNTLEMLQRTSPSIRGLF